MDTMKTAQLVYQMGIANVIRDRTERVCQGTFRDAEMFAAGMVAAGFKVTIDHCDKSGDILRYLWNNGPGDLWMDRKRPFLVTAQATLNYKP